MMGIKEALNKRSVPNILKKMNNTNSMEEIRQYEDQLIATILSSLCFVAVFFDFFVRISMDFTLYKILITDSVFLISSLLLDYSAFKMKNIKLRKMIISTIFVFVYMNVFYSYYDQMGTILWTGLFVLILMSVIRTEKTVFVTLGFMTLFLNLNNYIYSMDKVIILDKQYHLTQIVLFVVVFIVGLLWNNLLTTRLESSINRYNEVVVAKENITQLFEEVTATEEELRQQNIQLSDYNEEIKKNQERLNYMAYNDNLTGLPNRKNIIERMNFLIDASEERIPFAIVFIDLDGFKKINDTMGHHVGDDFLRIVAKRLLSVTNTLDTVGRFGGDEFAVLIQHDCRVDQIYEDVDKMREILSEVYEVDGKSVYSSASCGIALYPTDATEVADLLKAADVAMYKAKFSGKNSIEFFKQNMHEEILYKIELEQELVNAINNEEFYLMYQPQYNLDKHSIIGFEALIRWQSPKRGIVSPIEFIPLLEEMKAIVEVGDWVLVESCKKIVELKEVYDTPLKMSVNVSPVQMENETFIDRVKEVMDSYNILPGELIIEITESIFIGNLDKAIERIQALKAIGVGIALDDFGTGYSSLSYLRKLPIDVLKIDKSFIWDLDKGEKERKIVGTLIDLVHDMDITVIAEGVETKYQKDYLEKEACDHIQGYLISRPLDAELIENTMNKYIPS